MCVCVCALIRAHVSSVHAGTAQPHTQKKTKGGKTREMGEAKAKKRKEKPNRVEKTNKGGACRQSGEGKEGGEAGKTKPKEIHEAIVFYVVHFIDVRSLSWAVLCRDNVTAAQIRRERELE